jgi:hypothetical protein
MFLWLRPCGDAQRNRRCSSGCGRLVGCWDDLEGKGATTAGTLSVAAYVCGLQADSKARALAGYEGVQYIVRPSQEVWSVSVSLRAGKRLFGRRVAVIRRGPRARGF